MRTSLCCVSAAHSSLASSVFVSSVVWQLTVAGQHLRQVAGLRPASTTRTPLQELFRPCLPSLQCYTSLRGQGHMELLDEVVRFMLDDQSSSANVTCAKGSQSIIDDREICAMARGRDQKSSG